MEKEKRFKSFKDFTNLYEVQKTLRFELKPVGKTEVLIEANKILEKDKLIDDNYHKIKYYFDLLHKKFINETLADLKLDLKNYYDSFLALDKNDEKTKKNLDQRESELRRQIVDKFAHQGDIWKEKYNSLLKYEGAGQKSKKVIQLKQKGVEVLFEKDNIEILRLEFKNKPQDDKDAPDIEFFNPFKNKKENLFDGFRGLTTYFTNFNTSRRNFYDSGDKNTAVGNRTINENLRRFCENKKLYEQNKNDYKKAGINSEEAKIFDLDFFNQCLTQSGIKKYNEIIGRKTNEEGRKGVNQKINEYRQKTKEKIDSFKKFYDQILGDKEKQNDKFIEINNDNELFAVVKDFINYSDAKNRQIKELLDNFFCASGDFDLARIYLKRQAINTISRRFFGENWLLFENSLPHRITSNKDEKYKLFDFASIKDIKNGLLGITPKLPKNFIYSSLAEIRTGDLFSEDYKNDFGDDNWQTFLNIWKKEFNKNLNDYRETKDELLRNIIANGKIEKNRVAYKENGNDVNETAIIKNFSDYALRIFQMASYFALEKGRKPVEGLESENEFYNSFDDYYQNCRIIAYYNGLRNYLTKKNYLGRLSFPVFDDEQRKEKNPLSKRKIDGAEKILLNFEKTHDHDLGEGGLAILFRKSDEFFIGVFVSGKKFKPKEIVKGDFELMKYTQLKWKTLVGKGYKSRFGKKYNDEQNEQAAIKNAKEIIETVYSPQRKYKLLGDVLPKEYADKKEFRQDVESLLDKIYGLNFVSVDEADIYRQNQEGNLYLFQINNKDFRKTTKGRKNLHTYYFEALFDPSKRIKLNSAVEFYFRPQNKDLKTKEAKTGKKEVIDHRRYSEDKFFIHLSIILNFGKEKIRNNVGAIKGYAKKLNAKISEKIIQNEVKIIGIDRGENNLAYYAIIDPKGKLLESGSFNNIEVKDKNGKIIDIVDYVKKLNNQAENREEARKNWQTIANIKELKNGYVSQVIRKICDLILRENAIVVFEDLNIRFKQKRSALDFPVYQKLELALVKKLNYLANKETREGEVGHYLNALQLTSPIMNFRDIGKQTGIIFYVSPSYTSITCPICGFRKNISFHFSTVNNASEQIKKIKFFVFDEKMGGFRINYSTVEFAKENNGKENKKRRNNELFAGIAKKDSFQLNSTKIVRYKWHRNNSSGAKIRYAGESEELKTEKGIVKRYDITECLQDIFTKNGIGWEKGDIGQTIAGKDLPAEFYKSLFYCLDLLLFSRVSISEKERKTDYIHCARCGFDSRNGFHGQGEFSGDTNGAYNIARKGMLIIEKIRQFKNNGGDLLKMSWGDLSVSIEEWDKFTQLKKND